MFHLPRLGRRVRGKHGIGRSGGWRTGDFAAGRRTQLGIDREIAAPQRGVQRMNGNNVFANVQELIWIRDHDLLPRSLVVGRERVVPQHAAGNADARDLLAVDPHHRAVIDIHPQRQARRNVASLHIEHPPQIDGRKLVLHRDRSPVVAIAVADRRTTVFPTVVLVEPKRSPCRPGRGSLAGAFAVSPAGPAGGYKSNRLASNNLHAG